MVQSAAIKQGRLANRKHTFFFFFFFFFFFALADPTIYVPNQNFQFIQHRRPCCVIIRLF